MTYHDDPPRRNKGLGRGLSALLGEDSGEETEAYTRARGVRTVPVEDLRPGRYQPRQRFDDDEMRALVESVARQGILQPILVRRDPDGAGRYEIVAGERRWRAAQAAQLHSVPVLLRELSDTEALQIALIENIQRQDLNPLEEAEAYRRLMDEFGHPQSEVAEAVGKSRSYVANAVRLLSLPDDVKDYVRSGRLSAGAARAVITAENPAELAREIVERGLNVREVEAIRRQVDRKAPPKANGRKAAEKDPDTRALEQSLADSLGLSVDVRHAGARGGEVRIGYRTLEQLDEICRRLTRPERPAGDR